ncbi:hypothetical protein HD806DRAFT_541459 [Xylariaceae sp. AK1471]|nr:hypothetical protein HD806DRAFT_541459 [Xylariaceae sp. AK1471]
MKWSTVISFVAIAMTPAAASPTDVDVLDVRQGPASGWFYQYNQAQNGCDPPWGILSQNGVGGLLGACCKSEVPRRILEEVADERLVVPMALAR